jgi:hypothetical protein
MDENSTINPNPEPSSITGLNDTQGTQEIRDERPQELEKIGRNPDGTFKEGHEKIPGSGRPKDTLKAYARQKLSNMTPEEKEEFLKQITPEMIWKMAEGNPKQDTDVTTNGESLNKALVAFIDGKDSDNQDPDRVQETI